MSGLRKRAGYILVETIVAMGLLSIGAVTIQSAIRQAIITRGQAQDYTTARFLLEKVVNKFELQPQVKESSGQGTFDSPNDRFSYQWEIKKVEVPKPEIPLDIEEVERERLEKLFTGYMGKVAVRIAWTRAGKDFEAIGETLLLPEKLWLPPEPK